MIGTFQGNAQAFQTSLANEPILIAAALVVIYVILGMLYESFIHPLTILSTLPSAGVGALLALMWGGFDLSVIGIIGMMTTMAAMLGGVPLMLGGGAGSEVRQPLGYAMVGGLALSQLLTLYTTPVVYLYLDRLQLMLTGERAKPRARTVSPAE